MEDEMVGDEKRKEEPFAKEKDKETIKILVVDDEVNLSRVLSEVLSDAGYYVEVANTGREALDRFKESSFDIAITDLKMPDIDGMEILKKLKTVDPEICVVMLTGYSTVESAVEAMKAGAYDYISKPFNIEELKLIIEKAVERRNLGRQAKEKEYYRELSITDGLTKIYNHRYFHEALTRELKRARRYPQPVTLILMDLDDFKLYNDSWGHLMGDKLLTQLALLLSKNVRETNIVARYGGEEFAVIMPETDKEEGLAMAKRVMAVIDSTKFERDDVFPAGRLAVSMGLAAYPEDSLSKNGLIQAADDALYEAKREGKHRICVYRGSSKQQE